MTFIQTHLITIAVLALLSACASSGGSGSAAATEPESGGIRTNSIRAAPVAQRAQNDSRPLSELNTPDAIAAREAARRNGTFTAPIAPPQSSAVAATEAVLAHSGATSEPTAHTQVSSLQKGGKVRLRSGAVLRERPAANGEAIPSTSLGGEVELGPQIYNAVGYWWYVTAGKDSGWLLQTDIAR